MNELRNRIARLRAPLEEWLGFYDIVGSSLSDQELINRIVPRIVNYREMSYTQNRLFEERLGIIPTGLNEDRNMLNWNNIVQLHHDVIGALVKQLGGTYEKTNMFIELRTLSEWIGVLQDSLVNIQNLLEDISGPISSDSIMDIIELIRVRLNNTRTTYRKTLSNRLPEMIRTFNNSQGLLGQILEYIEKLEIHIKNESGEFISRIIGYINVINTQFGLPISEGQTNRKTFDIFQDVINTLIIQRQEFKEQTILQQLQIQEQKETIKQQQEQIQRLQEQLNKTDNYNSWKQLAIDLIDTNRYCRH
jgi:hypothetical protein